MQDMVQWLATTISCSDKDITIAQLRNEISYSLEYQGMRSVLSGLDCNIKPAYSMELEMEEDKVHVIDSNTGDTILTVPAEDIEGYDADEEDTDLVWGFIYDNLWDAVADHYGEVVIGG